MVEELKILNRHTTIFDTNAHYVIPLYQRDYAWKDKEIIQLIEDIMDIESSENYYIGSLIVSRINKNDERYEVVDGQQRLTTLYLLLQYLNGIGILAGPVKHSLSFDCRPDSDYALSHIEDIIQKVLKGNIYFSDGVNIPSSILNAIKIIHQKFSRSENISNFITCLKRVILYRIEVPEHTDLNRYFEIMNTHGEQLEQHDILKARLMKPLKDVKEQEFFARVWNACSDMNGYVQMHFSPKEREIIFGKTWNAFPKDEWEKYEECMRVTEDSEGKMTIDKIIDRNFIVNDVDGTLDDNTRIRFESIIDFPYFLLHALRTFVRQNKVGLEKNLGNLLDDKKLLDDFKHLRDSGIIDSKPIRRNKSLFSRKFIIHLLQTRYLFDKFIIKREYTGDDREGNWSLKELLTSGQASKKKAYYINTRLKRDGEMKKTYDPRNKECLMIQSALRVSYTSPKIMHWITVLLYWLMGHHNNDNPQLVCETENIARQATKKFLDDADYKLGVQTPHIVFNYLDYLLWKENKKRYDDFEFEFRNSVEHWYPQNPSDQSMLWSDKDTFGNLCIISRSINSRFSNLPPTGKMASFSKNVKNGSLKLRLMGDIIQTCTDEQWRDKKCQEHEKEMLQKLYDTCQTGSCVKIV